MDISASRSPDARARGCIQRVKVVKDRAQMRERDQFSPQPPFKGWLRVLSPIVST